MKSILLGLALASLGFAAEFFVSPTGTPQGNGSTEQPWDLATALKHPATVRPGDTIWVLGGTYRPGILQARLTGTPEAPIIVRKYRDERAVIDGAGLNFPTMQLGGAHTWYWGLEITNSDIKRVFTDHLACYPQCRGEGLSLTGPGNKLINSVIHDAGSGVFMSSNAVNAEAYGNLIYHNGWQSDSRGHGHEIYAQNSSGTMRIVDNILFGAFHSGIHIYGSSQSFLNNFHIEGNTVFGNGLLASDPNGWGILVGGNVVARNIVIRSNALYNPYSFARSSNLSPTYGLGTVGLTLIDNISAGPWALRYGVLPQDLTESGNTWWGRIKEPSLPPSMPAEQRIIVRPNQYERNRATVTVFNGNRLPQVDVDVSTFLARGEEYELIDAQNYFGPPIAKGTYATGLLPVAMTSTAISPAVGNVPRAPVHTTAEFGVFVLRKTGDAIAKAREAVERLTLEAAAAQQTFEAAQAQAQAAERAYLEIQQSLEEARRWLDELTGNR